MRKFWLILLRIICILQILIAVFQCFASLIGFLAGDIIFLLQAIAFAFITALPVFAFAILNNNFPNKPIEGRQKKNFNRLFLINFLLISFLFGFVFLDFKEAMQLSKQTGMDEGPDLFLFIPFIVSCAMLVFHLIILFGLFWLRSYITMQGRRKQFDFEMQDENI